MEDQLEKVKPDPSILSTPPSEPWLNSKDLVIGTGFMDPIAAINNEKHFAPLLELEKKLHAILSEDSTHLLRKAQTAISKAIPKD